MDPRLHLALLEHNYSDDVVEEVRGLTPLLACERLKRVHIEGIVPSGPTGWGVLEELAARGVHVDDLVPSRESKLAPFTDPILKLVVLNALDLAGTISLPETYFFDDNTFDDDNLDRLMAIEITQEQLDSIESLDWDPARQRDAIFLVWEQWEASRTSSTSQRWTASRRSGTLRSCGWAGRCRPSQMSWPPSCGNGASRCVDAVLIEGPFAREHLQARRK
jgi:hypothetical protein